MHPKGRYLAFCRHSRSGFSLIEVMIVVAIIGILATLAYPSLDSYLAQSKQSEAKTNLVSIYTAQKLYRATNDTYADTLDKLGLDLPAAPNDAYTYGYTISTAGAGSSFRATATANLDDDTTEDEWTIDQDKQLQNTVNDITAD
jgi:type IV pilus assembly protein PilA